jgi:glycine cleavage system H protein
MKEDQTMVAILVLLTIITCLTVDYLNERAKLRAAAAALEGAVSLAIPPSPIPARPVLDLTEVPEGVFFAPGHTWLELEPDGGVHIGADRLPATLLGGIDSIEAVPAGTDVRQGDRLAVLRRGERSVELRAPLDGTVTAAHEEMLLNPGRLAEEPFGKGWLLSVKPRQLGAALRRLFVADEAREFLRHELATLRETLVGLSCAHRGALATATLPATLPDGGLPVDGIASRLSAEEWNEVAERLF